MRPVLFAVMLLSGSALAADEEWVTVIDGPPIVVKNRSKEGSPIKEIWGEGDVTARVEDIQSALLDVDSFSKFMPNVRGAASLNKSEPDGSYYVYTQVDLPILSGRDYAVRIWNDEKVKPDGTGAFRQRWTAAPDKLPEVKGYVRLKVNDGSWTITPVGDGSKSHVVYKFSTDPAGNIPNWAKDMGNKKAVVDVIQAVEKEAQRRAAERAKKATAAPAPAK